jgi:hypothetical protein
MLLALRGPDCRVAHATWSARPSAGTGLTVPPPLVRPGGCMSRATYPLQGHRAAARGAMCIVGWRRDNLVAANRLE